MCSVCVCCRLDGDANGRRVQLPDARDGRRAAVQPQAPATRLRSNTATPASDDRVTAAASADDATARHDVAAAE